MKVPVHLVAGHLGAGKTSVLRHLLARRPPAERVGVVVNDFGLARIDAALLGGAAVEQRDIAGACVCCTAPAGFAAAVAELLPRVDRLFVEPTGLARPADLVDTLRRAPFADRIALRPTIVVVDPGVAAEGATEVIDGLAVAEILVVNRIDRATDADRAALHARLGGLWPGPRRVLETTHGSVPDDVLDDAPPSLRILPPTRGDGHDHATLPVQAPPETVFARDGLLAALASPAVTRAKGLVRTDEGWIEVQKAGGTIDTAPTAWRRDTRLDLIGRADADLGAVASAVLSALARSAGDALEVAWPGGTRTFDRAQLAALPGLADVGAAFAKRTGSGAWLEAVLAAAGAPAAGSVVVTARDGYVSSPTAAAALAGGVLVHSLGEGPLPEAQGGPFRVLVPGEVSCANVKGVARIVVRP
jgi:G3E family GTPase